MVLLLFPQKRLDEPQLKAELDRTQSQTHKLRQKLDRIRTRIRADGLRVRIMIQFFKELVLFVFKHKVGLLFRLPVWSLRGLRTLVWSCSTSVLLTGGHSQADLRCACVQFLQSPVTVASKGGLLTQLQTLRTLRPAPPGCSVVLLQGALLCTATSPNTESR